MITHPVEETGFNTIRNVYRACIAYFKKDGLVAVDITITPGRKYMSAIAMYSGMAEDAKTCITSI